jgi:hypothetical protein
MIRSTLEQYELACWQVSSETRFLLFVKHTGFEGNSLISIGEEEDLLADRAVGMLRVRKLTSCLLNRCARSKFWSVLDRQLADLHYFLQPGAEMFSGMFLAPTA